MRKILNYLFDHRTLDRRQAEEVLTNIARNSYSESEIAAFLTVYLMRSVTVEELSGFRDALLIASGRSSTSRGSINPA